MSRLPTLPPQRTPSNTCQTGLHERCLVKGCSCHCHIKATVDLSATLHIPRPQQGVTQRLKTFKLKGPVQLSDKVRRGWEGRDWYGWVDEYGHLQWSTNSKKYPTRPHYVVRVQVPRRTWEEGLADTVRRELR